MAPTDRQPTESHLAAARSRMVSIQSSLHACVGRHLFSDCAASPAGAGLARVARLSPACRRRSGGAGRHFSRTTRHRRPGGIGSHGSPFPCLPAAIRRSGGGAGQAHFFSDCAASLAGAGLARAARLSLACRRRSDDLGIRRSNGRHLFSDCAASPAGRDWLARLAFPLPAGGVRRSGGRYLFRNTRHCSPGRDWLARLAVPLPAGGDQAV